MKTIILGVSSVVFTAVSALPNAALAQQVQITGFAHGGSGCPQGTVSSLISGSPGSLPNTLSLLFTSINAFEATQGSGVPPSQRQKNCNVAINLAVPQGYSFSLFKAEYRGYANIPAGVRGVETLTYSFPFSANSATFQTVLNGIYRGNYQRTDRLETSDLAWSPCVASVPLNLRTSVALRGNRTRNASMKPLQITGRVVQRYGIQWRRCST